MQEANWWKTWPEARALSDGKRLVFYGRSEDWIPKSLKKVTQTPDYIVDMNEGYHGTAYQGIEVFPPEKLFGDDKDNVYVIITSGVYEGIVENLLREGFEAGRHFCCCPEYRDFLVLDSIRNYRQDVYITCCDYNDSARTRGSRGGGGIFRYSLPDAKMEKLAEGQYRQVVVVEDRIYAVAYVEQAIHVFNWSFDLLETHPLDHPNYCGIAHDRINDTLAVVNAGTDEILILSRTDFREVDRITFSRKSAQGQNSAHHLNDVCIDGASLFVSYFSHSGNWKIGQYDGGVSNSRYRRAARSTGTINGSCRVCGARTARSSRMEIFAISIPCADGCTSTTRPLPANSQALPGPGLRRNVPISSG